MASSGFVLPEAWQTFDPQIAYFGIIFVLKK